MKQPCFHQAARGRELQTVVLIFIGIALLLGATFAWRDLSQHRTKDAMGRKDDAIYRNVTLNNQNTNTSNWEEGQRVQKNVSVTNGLDSAGDICVRLSIKEFMQLLSAPTQENFLDEHGNPVLFATFASGKRKGEHLKSAEAEQLGLMNYGRFPVQTGRNPLTGEVITEDYATTNVVELQNGIYGKPMEIPGEITKVWGTAPRSPIDFALQSTEHGECAYNPYLWDGVGVLPGFGGGEDGTRTYVEFEGAPIITLKEWSENGQNAVGNGQLQAAWVVDPEDGWVYWAKRLSAGQTTTDLITAQTLIQNPVADGTEGTFNYTMHVDLQATDHTEQEIVSVFGGFSGVDTLEQLKDKVEAGAITAEKFDLIKKLVYGTSESEVEVHFHKNLPDDVAVTGMPLENPQVVDVFDTITKPANPASTGLTFLFWSENADASLIKKENGQYQDAFDFSTRLRQDTHLYAIWGAEITFQKNLGGNQVLGTQMVLYGQFATPLESPEADNATFLFWSALSFHNLASQFSFSSFQIKRAQTLYGIWETTITFNVAQKGGSWPNDGGNETKTASIRYNGTLESLIGTNGQGGASPLMPTPVRLGYLFQFWSTSSADNATAVNTTQSIQAHTLLYAHFKESKVTVTFASTVTQGGDKVLTGIPQPKTISHGATIQKPSPDPTLTGFHFVYWSTSQNPVNWGDPFDFNSSITADLTLYAHWGVKITFKPVGGRWAENAGGTLTGDKVVTVPATSSISSLIGTNGSVAPPSPPSTPPGQSFAFWSESSQQDDTALPVPASLVLTQDLTLYANYGHVVKLRAWAKLNEESSANGHFPNVVDKPTEVQTVIPNNRTLAVLTDQFRPIGGSAAAPNPDLSLLYWTEDPTIKKDPGGNDIPPVKFEGSITKTTTLYALFGAPVVFHARPNLSENPEYFTRDGNIIFDWDVGGLAYTVTRTVAVGGTIGGLEEGVLWNKAGYGQISYALRFWTEAKNKDLVFEDLTPAEREQYTFDFTTPITSKVDLYAMYATIDPDKDAFIFRMRIPSASDWGSGFRPNNGHSVDDANQSHVSLNIDPHNVGGQAGSPIKNDFIIDWGGKGTNKGVSKPGQNTIEPVEGTNKIRYIRNIKDCVSYQYDDSMSGQLVTIRIYGTMPGGMRFSFAPGLKKGDRRLEYVDSPLLPMLNDDSTFGKIVKEKGLSSLFAYCSNLKMIDPKGDLFANNPHITKFGDRSSVDLGTFVGTESLTFTQSQLSNLFANNRDATDMTGVFAGMKSLKTVPANVFARNQKIEVLDSTFQGSGLTSVSNMVFANNVLVKRFDRTFADCPDLTGDVLSSFLLFSNQYQVTTFEKTFQNCSAITGSISPRLFDHAVNVERFTSVFENCSSLTGSIPEQLFKNAVNADNFDLVFSGCSKLTGGIPADLFKNCTKVTSMTGVFKGCKGLTGNIPARLFWYNPAVTGFSQTFEGCEKLSGSLSVDLFKKNPGVITFYRTFFGCEKLTGLSREQFVENKYGAPYPDRPLEGSNQARINFVQTFEGCTNLDGIAGTTAPAIWNTHVNTGSQIDGSYRTYRGTKVANNMNQVPAEWK